MKRIIIALIMALAAAHTMQAQEIFTEIRNTAKATADNQQANPLVRKMAMKMREEMPDSTAELLDKEALSLNIFITKYTNALVANSQQPAAFQTKIIKAFMDASYSNPLFKDTDQDLVLVYFRDGDCLTRFSLDTDWRRAVLAADEAMKKL